MFRNLTLIIFVLLAQVFSPLSAVAGTVQPDLSFSPAAIDFGSVTIDTDSSPVTVTITNNTNIDIGICMISIVGNNANQFRIDSTNGTEKIAPQGTASVSLIFHPFSIGVKTAFLQLYAHNSVQGTFYVPLRGTGTAVPPPQPDISVSPTSLDFSSVFVNTASPSQSITISNTGTVNLTIGNLSINNAKFTITSGNISGQIIIPGNSAIINLIFTPTAAGAQAGILTIPSNDPDESTVYVSLTGTGATAPEPKPDINVNPTSLDFGSVLVNTSSSSQSVIVSNTGTANLTIGNLSIDNANFTISSGNISGQTIIPGDSVVIRVIFTPIAAGLQAGTMTIYSNDTDVDVALTGTGTAGPKPEPDISVEPTSLDFGLVPVNTNSPSQTVTVNNSGHGAARFEGPRRLPVHERTAQLEVPAADDRRD